jgi:anti-sigma-K factor RskA
MMQTQQETALRDMAGEYVLGTLTGDERSRFEELVAADLALQAEVTAWEERLAPMLNLVEPVVPPPGLWSRIESGLQPVAPRQKAGVWESISFWRNLGMVAVTLVLVLGLTVIGVRNDPAIDQVLMVTGEQSQVQWVVGTSHRSEQLQIKAVAPPQLPTGMVCQLWMENPDGTLMPVGVLPHTGIQSMRIPAQLGSGSRFKVSIEPADRLPKKRPTDKFVFEGNLTRI